MCIIIGDKSTNTKKEDILLSTVLTGTIIQSIFFHFVLEINSLRQKWLMYIWCSHCPFYHQNNWHPETDFGSLENNVLQRADILPLFHELSSIKEWSRRVAPLCQSLVFLIFILWICQKSKKLKKEMKKKLKMFFHIGI